MSVLELQIGLQPKQEQFFDLVQNSKATWLGYGGALGGAKSDALRKIMLARRLQFKGTRGLIFRRTYDDLWDNHITKFFEHWPITREWYNGEHHEITLPGGSVIKFDYAQKTERGSKIAEFQGKEFMDIGVDEATHLTESELAFLKTRNRWPGVPASNCKMILTCNPGNVGHAFIKRIFVSKEYHENENAEDYAFIQAYGWDNVEWARTALAAGGYTTHDYYYKWTDKQRFEFFVTMTSYGKTLNSLPESLRIGSLLGNWHKFAGQYFDIFDRKLHVSNAAASLKPWYPKWISIDWGFDHPSAVYWHCALPGNKFATYREYVERGLEPKRLAQEIAERSGSDQNIEAIYMPLDADAERNEHDTIFKQVSRELQSRGFPALSHADRSRVSGWMLLYQLLKSGSMTIDQSCAKLIDKIPTAVRYELDTGKSEDIIKGPGDDEIDSWRYGYKSRLEPAQEPLEDRILAGVSQTLERHGFGEKNKPSETYRQMLMARQTRKEMDSTEGVPFVFRKPRRGAPN